MSHLEDINTVFVEYFLNTVLKTVLLIIVEAAWMEEERKQRSEEVVASGTSIRARIAMSICPWRR